MWTSALFSLSFLLGARSFFLAFFQKKAFVRRLLSGLFGTVYLFIALLFALKADGLFTENLKVKGLLFLGLALPLAFLTLRVLRGKSKPGRSVIKSCSYALFFLLCFVNLTLLTLSQWSEDRPVLKLTVTGQTKQQWIEWQNPMTPHQKRFLTTYEVRLEDPKGDGKMMGSFYVCGQLVGVRAKVLRFSPLLNFFGITNLCQVDALYNGYRKMELHHTEPHEGYPLLDKSSLIFSPLIWSYWEKLYSNAKAPEWVKAANLESCYFPLTDTTGAPCQKSYLLTITEGGLSALPINPS